MRRSHATAVHQAWRRFQHGKSPRPDSLDLARRLLSGEVPDPTNGATHFYTPKSMPKAGAMIPDGSDIGGGLESVAGVKDSADRPIKNYRPAFAADPRFQEVYVEGVSDLNFKFFEAPGTGSTRSVVGVHIDVDCDALFESHLRDGSGKPLLRRRRRHACLIPLALP